MSILEGFAVGTFLVNMLTKLNDDLLRLEIGEKEIYISIRPDMRGNPQAFIELRKVLKEIVSGGVPCEPFFCGKDCEIDSVRIKL